MVKGVSLLGLLAVTFGPSYSYTLLRLVYSERWSQTEAPLVLGCYTAYILLLAVNGGSRCLLRPGPMYSIGAACMAHLPPFH
jgi:oligosaccharide translocation protein RFT1